MLHPTCARVRCAPTLESASVTSRSLPVVLIKREEESPARAILALRGESRFDRAGSRQGFVLQYLSLLRILLGKRVKSGLAISFHK